MSNLDLIRAWKDDDYQMSLSDAERAQLPENPIGALELTDEDLKAAAGGYPPHTAPVLCHPTHFTMHFMTINCCHHK